MRITRRLVDLLRRIIGIHNLTDVLVQQIGSQTAALQSHFSQRIDALALPAAQTASDKPGPAQSALPAELQTLCRLTQGIQSGCCLDLRDLCELEALSKRGLFIVGNVRSGTSILHRCLNLSKDVYMLDESDVFRNHSNRDFRSWYNQKHEGFRNAPIKGRFIPAPPIDLPGGLAYLAWLARHYRYPGEKITFGPKCAINGVPFQDVFFPFHSQFFFLATYLLIVRNPVECIWSSHKMFYKVPVESVIEGWLRSVNLAIDLYCAFPNCYLILFENLSSETIGRIAEILQTEIRLPPRMLNERAKQSRLSRGEIPQDLRRFRQPLEACVEIYDQIASLYSPHTLLYDGDGDMMTSLPHLLKPKIAQTLDSVIPGATCLKYKLAG